MLSRLPALALARSCLGAATVLNALEMHVLLGNIADGAFAMPVTSWIPTPGHAWVNAYLVLTLTAAVAITAGYCVPLAAGTATLLNGAAFLWDQQTYSNHRWLAFCLVALLGVAYLSRRPRPPSGGWPELLMMTQLSVCYAFAALSKVNPVFLSGEPLVGWLRWELPLWSTQLLSVGTVLTELFLAVGLWFARTRILAVVLGVLLHGAIVAMMWQQTAALVAFSLTCLGIYPLFLARGSGGTSRRTTSSPVGTVGSGS